MAASTHRENSQANKIIADGLRSLNADKRYGNLLQNRQWENSGALLLNTPTRFRENGHYHTAFHRNWQAGQRTLSGV